MKARPIPTTDLDRNGRGTVCWFLTPEICPLLSSYHFARIGINDATFGFERVRQHPGGSFFMETASGEGCILLEGKWQRLVAGEVTMAPPRVLNAFYTPQGKRWRAGFIRYDEPPGVRPLIGSSSPLRNADEFRLTRALEGLRDEWEHERSAAMLTHWLALIDGIARRLALPWKMDDRLDALWTRVAGDLAASWTLTELAKRSGFSAEHLRRLCLKTLGRTPMEHVAFMRMQHACGLLSGSDDKVDYIARAVGYATGHAFSRAFQRSVGLAPSEFRARR